MEKKYTEIFELRACNCDMGGAWRPSAILEAMQETAGVHSSMFGLDRSTMNGLGIAWVLSRLKVEFSRMPVIGEKITIETFPLQNRHLFFPRAHVFIAENGEVIGRAHSLWVTIDIADRKIVKNETVMQNVPNDAAPGYAAAIPATVRALESEVVCGSIIPAYTDLDQNMHVNNTKYLDWCCNALGVNTMTEKCILSFDVNYDAEVLPGCEIRTELTMDGDAFAFVGYSGDKKHFSVGGRLADR